MKAIRVNELRRVTDGVWTGATGAGVIVGVYDTGIDFRHADFSTRAAAPVCSASGIRPDRARHRQA